MTIEELISGCQKQEPKAQHLLYQRFAGRVMGICMRYADSRDDAKDIFQESFIRVFKNIDKLQNIGTFEAWLRRLVVNTALSYLQKNKKYQTQLNEEVLIETAENEDYRQILAGFSREDLVALINRLPTGYRTVFNLYVIEGYAHQEIAQMLETSETNSKNQLMKAKRALQKMINEQNLYENYERKLG
ncbi:MAG: RNA polymerase sigma factor [Microscillaceae bacterium]|jgi:RNA polymerase sigma-70 factor (ECF subfamily)|nr:RNA polymerase sigma factor [Microscillaceae bacterium]